MLKNNKTKRHFLKEGAGSGVLIQVSEFRGTLTSVEDGGNDCDCILHLEDCWMDNCSICTYEWCSPEWFDGYFNNGTVDLKVTFIDALDEDEIKENINAIEIGQKIDDEDFTISHGGGWVHQSLKDKASGDVFDGKVSEWRNNHPHSIKVKDKDGYYIDCEIDKILFDFGDQIEEVYQAVEGLYLEDDEELVEDDSIEDYEESKTKRQLRSNKNEASFMSDYKNKKLDETVIDSVVREIRSKYDNLFDTISVDGNKIILHFDDEDASLEIEAKGTKVVPTLCIPLTWHHLESKQDVSDFVKHLMDEINSLFSN